MTKGYWTTGILAALSVATGFLISDGVMGNVSAGGSHSSDTVLSCDAVDGVPEGFGKDPHAGMKRIPAGVFTPGTHSGYPDEQPAGAVQVDAFWIDRTEVTNAQFAAFVSATGYVTEAERDGGAVVFRAPPQDKPLEYNGWWHYREGADWRHPEGPDSDLEGRKNHPVVNVTLADAKAYADWLGRTLPTESQWEWAALGGGDPELLEREPKDAAGQVTANYWQGVFPFMNTEDDGFVSRAPVGCFPANGYGLYDMIGNVWEWTVDPYRGPRQEHGLGQPEALIAGPEQDLDPRVIKGGSFLCATDFCVRYRAAARHPQDADLGVTHLGFRTVLASTEN
ncbi:Sulfatase modifying factor 1 precursor (C-alpha-formyglycine- generating enzyme 1) [Marinobacterium lacunae]|uniref:Sulfatase modifying factor 1 (C-alpha-formyglycine-generating enzyme 1) n=1 Tax=Marinobacterium lacunae TaxID=1232683 RepID=A0A081FX09_9GAMM|nr:formylglycine-generating enzyme family protein [Marinobacterium lacunae]KEA63064.1 Sulfatase modifying factor 1 precursor (C-alpha-formyglycine- generating enzyme 1) [Marinobacterium lacunae]